MAGFVGLTQANALGDSSTAQFIEHDNIDRQVRNFLTDMQRIEQALWGNGNAEFHAAMTQFTTAYATLRTKLGNKADNLGQGHSAVAQTDADTEQVIGSVGRSIPSISLA